MANQVSKYPRKKHFTLHDELYMLFAKKGNAFFLVEYGRKIKKYRRKPSFVNQISRRIFQKKTPDKEDK